MLHAGSVPETDLATWDFKVFGEVESPITLSWEELTALPTTEVTHRHPLRHALEPLRHELPRRALGELAELVAAEAERALRRRARRAGLHANVPIAALEDENALIAYEADGEPLTPEHGWPLRLVIPSRYFWKSAKWLRGIELSADRRARLLGALRLPQRRRTLGKKSATGSSAAGIPRTGYYTERCGRRYSG